jgi:hypothetical protein
MVKSDVNSGAAIAGINRGRIVQSFGTKSALTPTPHVAISALN